MSIFAVFLLLLVFVGVENVAQGDDESCAMSERLHGEMVNIKKAKVNAERNNGTVSVPKALIVNSSMDCEQGCCGNINCTVYLFYPRQPSIGDQQRKFNCFFLNCRPQNLCSLVNVSNKAEGSVVGIRQLTGNTAEPKVTANLEFSTSEPLTTEESTQPSIVEESTPPTTTEEPKATTSLHLKEEKIKDDDNHTTTGSLIIALAFGILFFLAVLVLIGRPWWFSFRRPRYSKVDYLMNGL
ncbi:uncharacterized protein [Acropora muricata]|uniref:uncharacterized protein LOC114957399 isoform X1 n=1 Tax=Acropora millepora TaxID=45264 RepID=UPI001CF46899|nr:uncharacterized protein LOC114957399 isoform X1 [Acropora millepora]